ncbi:MAG: hypothetical protein ABIA93_06615 [Candidatus Woesearchaeota archaeon]
MPGAIVHVLVGVLAALIVHFSHRKLEYSLAIFLGNLLPDFITFGFTALRQLTLDVFHVQKDAFYQNLVTWTYNPANWFMIGFFVLGLGLFLYHYHFIKKKRLEEYAELYGFLLAGILIHLILDVLIMEQGAWI